MYKYTAVIVEPRKHKALDFVLRNALDCLSKEWRIILFHGTKNITYVKDLETNICNDRLCLVELPGVENLNNITYSELFTTRSIIYDNIDTEVFIVFQTDSIIFKKNAHKINEYIEKEYDYIGPPWLQTNYYYTKASNFIGNGGFSLRRKTKMLEIIDSIDWYSLTEYCDKVEDLFFSICRDNISVSKPEYNVALEFCLGEVPLNETQLHNTFACHQTGIITNNDNSNNSSYIKLLYSVYPELEYLKNLQYIEE